MKINLGCGRTQVAGYLGVDRVRGGGAQLVADAEHLPFRDDSLDEVRAFHVLEHVESLERTMHEVHRVLRPGGILEARVPGGLRSMYDPFHLRPFDKTTFTHFAKENVGLQAGLMFDLRQEMVYSIPYEWHVRQYFPWALFPRWQTDPPRFLLPLGPLREVRAWLTKR